MARNFRRPRSAQPIADLNVTNLIDLGFTLLIIFMIATPLIVKEQAIKLNLPTETARPQDKPDNTPVQAVSINKAGEIFWGTRKVTMAELASLMTEADKRAKPPIISVRSDRDATVERLMTVIDEVKKHPNLSKKLDIATQPAK
jgi:biopolymer transport protein TolR